MYLSQWKIYHTELSNKQIQKSINQKKKINFSKALPEGTRHVWNTFSRMCCATWSEMKWKCSGFLRKKRTLLMSVTTSRVELYRAHTMEMWIICMFIKDKYYIIIEDNFVRNNHDMIKTISRWYSNKTMEILFLYHLSQFFPVFNWNVQIYMYIYMLYVPNCALWEKLTKLSINDVMQCGGIQFLDS